MRRNWDYVEMDDYKADMAAQTAQAAGIIHGMKTKQRDVERMLVAVVMAAGGTVTVHPNHLRAADLAMLKVEHFAAEDTTILSVSR